MSITFFGMIWLFLIIFIFIRGKSEEMVRLLFIAMTLQQPAVVFFGENGVGPQIITSCAFVVWFFYFTVIKCNGKIIIEKHKFNRAFSCIACFLLILCIIASLYMNGKNNVIDNFGIVFTQLLIYIICFVIMWTIGHLFSIEEIKNSFVFTIKVVCIIGIIQFINTARIINLTSILKLIFYNNTNMDLQLGGSMYPWAMPRLYATFQEPSYCSAFLVGSFFFLIACKINNKKDIYWILLVLLEIILTFSSTAYGALAICGICYMIISRNKKALKFLVPVGLLAMIVLVLSGDLVNIINDVIFTKMDVTKSGSAWERNSWNEKSWDSFLSSPILGVGYKNCRASYFLYSILGQLGVLGLLSWIGIWIPSLLKAVRNKKNEGIVAISLFILGVIISMLISLPDIDFCIFWLAMYLMALYGGQEVTDGTFCNYTGI